MCSRKSEEDGLPMTENRRIFLNIAATYGRTVYGIVLGLLCGRWTLMALGDIDFGLNGLVGGLIVFVSFFNSVLASANSRFYAYSVGAAQVSLDKRAALEDCRRWFNTALSVHIVVPCFFMLCGYPIGVYAIEHWLTVPADRITACIWVFRFVCFSSLICMLNVPFSAMYTAKQYIAELTIYSFITTTLNVIVLYYMVCHPRAWLVEYSAWTCALVAIPQIIICFRACYIFPECRICLDYMWDLRRLRELGVFSAWQLIGCFSGMLRTNGMFVVVNKLFGPLMNSAQTIGNSVQGHCTALAGAMQGAFTPVIVQACGAGDYDKMCRFVMRTCKFNLFLSSLFLIPVMLELPKVLGLWLQKPPLYAVDLCYFAIAFYYVGCCTVGHMIAVIASGRVAEYYVSLGLISILTVPIAVVVGMISKSVFYVMSVVVGMEIVNSCGRVYFAKRIVGIEVGQWLRIVFLPALAVILISSLIGCVPHILLQASFGRLVLTTSIFEFAFLPLAWSFLMSRDEREFIVEKLLRRFKH